MKDSHDDRMVENNEGSSPRGKMEGRPGASGPLTIENSLNGRKAVTPAEFAKMFGHHPTWGYRKVYAGRVKVIRDAGRVLIPVKEIERFEADTVTYGELKSMNPSKGSRKNS